MRLPSRGVFEYEISCFTMHFCSTDETEFHKQINSFSEGEIEHGQGTLVVPLASWPLEPSYPGLWQSSMLPFIILLLFSFSQTSWEGQLAIAKSTSRPYISFFNRAMTLQVHHLLPSWNLSSVPYGALRFWRKTLRDDLPSGPDSHFPSYPFPW